METCLEKSILKFWRETTQNLHFHPQAVFLILIANDFIVFGSNVWSECSGQVHFRHPFLSEMIYSGWLHLAFVYTSSLRIYFQEIRHELEFVFKRSVKGILIVVIIALVYYLVFFCV